MQVRQNCRAPNNQQVARKDLEGDMYSACALGSPNRGEIGHQLPTRGFGWGGRLRVWVHKRRESSWLAQPLRERICTHQKSRVMGAEWRRARGQGA